MKRVLWIIVAVVAILVVAGLVFPRMRQQVLAGVGIARQTGPKYQTVTAERGDLTAYVGATGTVRSNQTARLVWQTSGQVGSVNAQLGQKVQANSILAQLVLTSLPQTIIMAQADLVNAQTALNDAMNNSKARADAEAALVKAQQDLNDAQKNTQSKLYQRASSNTIDIERANVILAQQEVDNATEEYKRVEGRNHNDAVYAAALSRLASARQTLTRAQYNLQYAQDLPDPLDVQLVYAQLDQAQATLLTAKQNWEKVKDGPNPDDIAAAQARVAAAQATLNTVHLIAPFNGTVTDVNVQTGDMVSIGTYAFQIDDLSRLLIDLQVSEVDINRAQVGQPVELTFDAVPNKTYAGTVNKISSVGTSTTGTVNFTVTIQVTNPDAQIRPGMTAAANIAVTQLKNVLLIPNRAVRVVNNQRVVYVLRNNQAVPVPVTLGPSDNVNSQLASGNIQPGDQIILNPPAVFGGGGGFGPGGGFGGGGGGGGGGNVAPAGGNSTNTPGAGGTNNPGGAGNPGGTSSPNNGTSGGGQ